MLQNIHFNINKIHKPMTVGSKSIKKNPEDMLTRGHASLLLSA
jgi:organic hydroperoxide reductase OsmC/OhrA